MQFNKYKSMWPIRRSQTTISMYFLIVLYTKEDVNPPPPPPPSSAAVSSPPPTSTPPPSSLSFTYFWCRRVNLIQFLKI